MSEHESTSTSPIGRAGESLSAWFQNPKTWIGLAVMCFTLGGSFTVFHQTLMANNESVQQTRKIVAEHHHEFTDFIKANNETHRIETEGTQKLLQEIIRINKVNCLNTAKDNDSRRSCLGVNER